MKRSPRPSLPPLGAARVLVVGDVMLDRYWYGTSSRLSPEAPVPVVQVRDDVYHPGGGANVAVNIAALGARAVVIGVTGDDADAAALSRRLGEAGVEACLVRAPGVRTIVKLRVFSAEHQLIRVDFEDPLAGIGEASLLDAYRARLPEADVVVLSDYGKGTLRDPQPFIAAARAVDRPVLVDPKGLDFSRYRGATLLTPCRSEFEAVAGRCADDADLCARGAEMLRDLSLRALLITRGAEGMTLLRDGCAPLHLPAATRDVRGVIGAGDTVIATLAAALAVGVPLAEATTLANAAAGAVVCALGRTAASLTELRRALLGQDEARRGVVTEDELVDLVREARARGETIALTPGCFDILHAGHVTYLEQIVDLADRVIIAVNDDDSVRRLKGAARPINTLDQRARVLAAIGAVDWVVPFREDTPERLVCRIKPDYLIKGGDYHPDQIPGQRCVREAGGQVLVLEYVDGVSTTNLVSRIQARHGRG
jgi:D-beta-D-heptose 7-phosphate kinase / D-beta-D-heptose 1-phosphate adenosyltransferase